MRVRATIAALATAMWIGGAFANDEILIVAADQLELMWKADGTNRMFRGPVPDEVKRKDWGCVNIAFVIESDGRTSSHRVLASQPRGALDRAGIATISRWRFRPGTANAGRSPVYTQATFTVGRVPVVTRGEAATMEDLSNAMAQACDVSIEPHDPQPLDLGDTTRSPNRR